MFRCKNTRQCTLHARRVPGTDSSGHFMTLYCKSPISSIFDELLLYLLSFELVAIVDALQLYIQCVPIKVITLNFWLW